MFKIDQTTLIKTVCTWGERAQIRQAKEECAELIVALSHYQRNPATETINHVAEEIADVLIMMHQLTIIFSPPAVHRQIDAKMKRLKDALARRGPVLAQGESYIKKAREVAHEIPHYNEHSRRGSPDLQDGEQSEQGGTYGADCGREGKGADPFALGDSSI